MTTAQLPAQVHHRLLGNQQQLLIDIISAQCINPGILRQRKAGHMITRSNVYAIFTGTVDTSFSGRSYLNQR